MAVVLYQEWKWKEVESEVKKAIALNPSFPTAHMLYCNMTRHLGRAVDAADRTRVQRVDRCARDARRVAHPTAGLCHDEAT